MEELIAHTPLAETEYDDDNAKVYHLLCEIVGGTTLESSIKVLVL